MARPIEIGIASETKAFRQGVESGVIKPIEDAEEALDALGKSKGPDRLEDGMKDAQKATERLKHETEETAEAIEQDFKQSYASVRRSSDDGMDGAKAGLKDFKQEAASTAKESAASFRGGADDIKGAIQEVAANAFAGFGPAGLAAGIATAAGIGIIGEVFDSNGEKAEEMSEAAGDAFEEMIEAGGRFLSAEVENQKIRDTLKDPAKYKDILAITEITGIAEAEVTRAIALNGTERQKALEKLKEMKPLLEGISQTDAEAYAIGQSKSVELDKQVAKLNDLNEIQGTALDLARLYDDATGGAVAKRSEERDLVQDRNRVLTETPTEVKTRLIVDDSALTRALSVQKSIDVVVNAVTKFGKPVR
jgi:hypothetical protein